MSLEHRRRSRVYKPRQNAGLFCLALIEMET